MPNPATRKPIGISIPADWRFSALQLKRAKGGDVSFDLDALRSILTDPADLDWLMTHPEGHLAEVLTWLYAHSVKHHGAEDPVVERLIAEVRAEDAPERVNRSRSLRIRLTPAEHALMESHAAEAGQTISQYVRARCCK
jgi:hypothetical protein